MIQRSLSLAVLALAGLAVAPLALAMGFGRVPDTIVFGQPLDLTIPLRLDAGDSLSAACVQAEVQIGEQPLPLGALQVAVEQRGDEGRVRLRAVTSVNEPVVAVSIAVGCGSSMSRQFVVFADPPEVPAAPLLPAAIATAPLAMAPLAAETSTRVQAPVRSQPPAARTVARKNARSKPSAAPSAAVAEAAPTAPARRAARKVPAAAPKAVAAAPAPRLKLEEPEALLKAAMATVAAQDAAASAAAQAASAAEAAASAAEQRMLATERQLRQMRDEAAASKAALEQMRSRVAEAEDRGRWQALLLGAVLLLSGLVAWLAWRLHALQRERQQAWWQAAAAGPTAAAASAEAVPASEAQEAEAPVAVPTPRLVTDSALFALDEVPPASAQSGAVLPPQPPVEELLAHPLSVDELIDLEQQAEFFLVLGEEESAIDLLMSHLRGSGGTSPLPYLKLLEIYRRRQDRDAYERTRTRFSQRFNAVAPDWHSDPEQGRELLDYPAVLATLQSKWAQPLDAMAELENLLFRQRSGELFELPAYRDVLSLYSVARDLQRHMGDAAANVDVLLPLGDDDGGRSGPASIFDTATIRAEPVAPEDRPTLPVDLDLSEPALAPDSRPAPLPALHVTLEPR